MDRTREWWDSLNDELKFVAYKNMKSVNESNGQTVTEIVNYLLGEDWYSMAMDTYSVNADIIIEIKHRYRNVNYSWNKTWIKIKKILREYLRNL